MAPDLRHRIGFEIELMAPPGLSRHTLALELAARTGGRVRHVWHHDSEPSLVPGLGRFLRLSQGFAVDHADGTPLCTLVDDITLLADLDPRAAAPPNWFRVLSDDPRLLRLLSTQADPGGTLPEALLSAGRLWGTVPSRHGDIWRLNDHAGATIALAAPQGGERERACELITPPLATDHHAALETLLEPARDLGFFVPREAAVHLHLDGGPFREAHALANVVRLFAYWREPLRALLRTNPACRRLAPLPDPLVAAVTDRAPSLDELRTAGAQGRISKFFDVNLVQVLSGAPVRDTLEVRILPGSITADEVVHQAALVELLLDRCLSPAPIPSAPADPGAAMEALLEIAAESMADREPV